MIKKERSEYVVWGVLAKDNGNWDVAGRREDGSITVFSYDLPYREANQLVKELNERDNRGNE
jgi:hypothetical protein